MANTLLINRTALGTLSGGEYPTWNSQTDPNVSNLDYGELAWNNGKQKLYIARVSDISGGKTLQQVGGTTALKVTDGSGSTDMAHDSTLTIQGTSNQATVSESSGTFTVSLPGQVNLTDLTVAGTLTVNGTTTTVNSTVVTVDDPIFTLGGDGVGVDDDKDRGIEFKWHNGSAAKVGFFGRNDNTGRFAYIADATNSSEVFSGTLGDAEFTTVYANVTGNVTGNTSGSSGSCTGLAATATALATARTIGGVSFNGTANISLPGVNASGTQDTSGNAATVTTNANLTGDITSVGNATAIASGVIVDADVKSDAAIAYSKLGTIPTWNQNTTGSSASCTGNAATVTNGVYTNSTIDGGTF